MLDGFRSVARFEVFHGRFSAGLASFLVNGEIDLFDLSIMTKDGLDVRFEDVARQVLDNDNSWSSVATAGRLFFGPASGPVPTVLQWLVDSHLGVRAADGSRRG